MNPGKNFPESEVEKVPLAIDLFCGLGGWTEALLAEGWSVVGFDIKLARLGLKPEVLV